jgi:hydroxymethylpyrimidine/phosphomethylpyrimidine kinase
MTIPRILIIAGSDSGGGAGIQADIKTVTMLGGHAMTAITAITAQNTLGVDAVMQVPPEMVLAQMDAVIRDIGVDVVKIGMIGNAETARAVAERLDPARPGHLTASPIHVVVDPVMVASSGAVLSDDETVEALELLMQRATLVTPNLPELALLSGVEITDLEGLREAAEKLSERIGTAVLAKGGHLPGSLLTDCYVWRRLTNGTPWGVSSQWQDERIETRHSHGTGCTLASAIATELGRGTEMSRAITRARDFVRAAMLAAPRLGAGHGPMGHHLGVVPFDEIEG